MSDQNRARNLPVWPPVWVEKDRTARKESLNETANANSSRGGGSAMKKVKGKRYKTIAPPPPITLSSSLPGLVVVLASGHSRSLSPPHSSEAFPPETPKENRQWNKKQAKRAREVLRGRDADGKER